MKKWDRYFIEMALEESHKSDCKTQHGAILVNRRQVISTGYNKYVGDGQTPLLTHFGKIWSIHAEMNAIRRSNKDELKGHTLYVARSNFTLSKPCYLCLRMIHKYGVSRVVYSTEYNKAEVMSI